MSKYLQRINLFDKDSNKHVLLISRTHKGEYMIETDGQKSIVTKDRGKVDNYIIRFIADGFSFVPVVFRIEDEENYKGGNDG